MMLYSAFAVLLAVANAQFPNPADYSCDDPVNNCDALAATVAPLLSAVATSSNALNGMGFICDEATNACTFECSTSQLDDDGKNACELIQTYMTEIKGLSCLADPNDDSKEYCQPADRTCDPNNDDCEARFGEAIGFCSDSGECIRPTPAPTTPSPTSNPTEPTAPTTSTPSKAPTPPTQADPVDDSCCGWTGLDANTPVRCEATLDDIVPAIKTLVPETLHTTVDGFLETVTVEDYPCTEIDGGFCEAACAIQTYIGEALADPTLAAVLTSASALDATIPDIDVDLIMDLLETQYGSQQAALDQLCAVEDPTDGWDCDTADDPLPEGETDMPSTSPTPPTPPPTYDCSDDDNFWEPTCDDVFAGTEECGIAFNLTVEFCQWRSKPIEKLLDGEEKARKRLTRVVKKALRTFVRSHPEVKDYWDSCDDDAFQVLVVEFIEPEDETRRNQGRMLGQTDGDECEDIDNLGDCVNGLNGDRTKNYLVKFTVQSLSCGVVSGSADGCESLRAFALKMYTLITALGADGVIAELAEAGYDIGIEEDTVCLDGVNPGFGSVHIPADGFEFCFTEKGECIPGSSITLGANSASGMYTVFAVMSAFIVALFN